MRGRSRLGVVAFLAAAVFLYASREVWLAEVGHFLVETDPLEKAEIAVVLAGDDTEGHRLLKAVELVERGYAERVLIPGPVGVYGFRESELALSFAKRRGLPVEALVPFPADITSTLEEALAVDQELRSRGVRKALVVTSNFHTRRARHIYRKHGSGEVRYIFVAAESVFDPDEWWKTRDGKEVLVIEYIKTLNSWFE